MVESVTVTVTGNVPLEAGVPVITPEVALMVNGDGSPVALQANGAVPLEAATGALYAEPTTPLGSAAVVIVSPVPIVMENCCEAVKCVGLVLSVAVTVKDVVPIAPGVPVMAPVEAFSVSPAGSAVLVQVTGEVPPVAASCPL